LEIGNKNRKMIQCFLPMMDETFPLICCQLWLDIVPLKTGKTHGPRQDLTQERQNIGESKKKILYMFVEQQCGWIGKQVSNSSVGVTRNAGMPVL
jgi:hypothetical protein